MNALQASKLCDITGIAGIACARHGCYAPQALVDLFKGEQQKNIDFAFLKALESTNVTPDQGVLLIYDIACQYFVHLQDRIGSYLPFGLHVDAAIGLFHVHAHKDQCFFQYATSFIPGAAIVAGEILESLWSSLNAISPTARTATLAHRAEMLDDHASDSNHKKNLNIVSTLCRSYSRAVDMLDHARTYHQNLSNQSGMAAVEKWTHDIETAEQQRKYDITAMDIYAAKLNTASEECTGPASGMPKSALSIWMDQSLQVEEKQSVRYLLLHSKIHRNIYRLEIQAKTRMLLRRPSSSDRQLVETAREQLTVLLNELKNKLRAAGVIEQNEIHPPPEVVSLDMWDEIVDEPVPTNPDAPSQSVLEEPAPPNMAQSSRNPTQMEDQLIPLPSNGNIQQDYRQLELSHRISHADHHLNRIRELIAEKSFQYSHVIRVSPRKGVNTHSRAAVKKLNLQISVHCRVYSLCRSKIQSLGGDPAILHRFKILTVDDIKASTAVINPNQPGSTSLRLSWIWQTAGGHRFGLATGSQSAGQGNDVNIMECKFTSRYFFSTANFSQFDVSIGFVHALNF